MYIISFNRGVGSDLFYYGRRDGSIHFCACKISCKHYKTFSGALKAMYDLASDMGYPKECFDIVFLPVDLCKEWGLIREGGLK